MHEHRALEASAVLLQRRRASQAAPSWIGARAGHVNTQAVRQAVVSA